MTALSDDIIVHGDCWLAYFDLLGFSSKVEAYAEQKRAEITCPAPRRSGGQGPESPSSPYTDEEVNTIKSGVQCQFVDGLGHLAVEYRERVLKALEDEATYQRQYERTLHYAHFSDTFILYTSDESRESFETLSSAAGNFFLNMLYDGEPLRGAVTCERFYADRDRNIFIGTALLDAHKYAEKQDWIGYVLTPEAVKRLSKMEPPIVWPGNYVWWKVPIKVKKTIGSAGGKVVTVEKEQLLAFQFAHYPMIRESIRGMKKMARNMAKEEAERKTKKVGNESREALNVWRGIYKGCRSKYLRTLLFMKHTKSMRSSRLIME